MVGYRAMAFRQDMLPTDTSYATVYGTSVIYKSKYSNFGHV